MSTLEVLLLIASGMFVGAILAFAYMFRLLLRTEAWERLRGDTMKVILRDMYGHNVEELEEAILRQHPN